MFCKKPFASYRGQVFSFRDAKHVGLRWSTAFKRSRLTEDTLEDYCSPVPVSLGDKNQTCFEGKLSFF